MNAFFPVTYTTLSAAALADTVLSEYDIGPIAWCRFYTPGMNDTYEVKTVTGLTYFLRAYRSPRRSRADVAYELDALLHLKHKGVPVAWPVARRDGAHMSTVNAPEGRRHIVLFVEAPGVEPEYERDPAGMSARYGRAVARMHNALDDFSSPHRRSPLDLEHLIEKPLRLVRDWLKNRPTDRERLREAGASVLNQLKALPETDLEQGFCHGDLQGYHARVAEDGTLTHFDFDFCGPGYRAYDLAVFRWCALLSDKQDIWWPPYLAAYREIRPLAAVDVRAIPLFVGARVIWHMGLHVANALDWGASGLSDAYFDRQLGRLETALAQVE
jgi:Ser/Thr protein kinase RdoA (MazF antagonist)